jgi:uncharacterized protein
MPNTQSTSPTNSFDVVVKVAERCNLACPHCYYFYLEYNGATNAPLITEAVADELPRFLVRSLDELNLQRINVVMHGGEPLLLKKPRFDELCRRLRETLDPLVDLRISVQTNGVLIDDEWVDIFRRHQVTVGVSIDGSKQLHDRHRPDKRGRGSYDGAVRGLRVLQSAVADGKMERCGALCTVHHEPETADVLRHLINDLGVGSPNLNFPRGGWDCDDAIRWNRELDTHRSIVRYWIDNCVYPKFHFVRGIAEVLLALRSDDGARHNDERASRQHHIATVSSEGKLLIDDNVLGIDDSFAAGDLTIFGTSLRDLIESPTWQKLNAAVDHVPAACEECPWRRSCRSGALFNRFSRQDGFDNKSVLCDTLQMIHEEVAGYLVANKLVNLETLAARLDEAPRVTGRDTLAAILR